MMICCADVALNASQLTCIEKGLDGSAMCAEETYMNQLEKLEP